MFDGFLGYVFGGALIGVLARILKPGPDPVGLIMTIAIGAAGAGIAGHFMRGHGALTWVVAIVSAIVLLAVWQWIFPSKRRRRFDDERMR